MAETNADNSTRIQIFTVEDLLSLELSADEKDVIVGLPENPLIRPKTKNLIEAPEKSYKTTFLSRLMMGLSCGKTVYPAMPVARKRKVLYLHGELSVAEIQERTRAAVHGLDGLFTDLLQGKAVEAHLIEEHGQKVLRNLVEQYMPDDLVLDPWQSVISGFDENSFKDISQATKFCDALIEAYRLTLWIAIHEGKDRQRGARGHSSVGGWRDTRIALNKGAGNIVRVTVQPRWAKSPPVFQLRFENGTLVPDAHELPFDGQNGVIRLFVEKSGGKMLKDELIERLGKGKEAGRKAIERAAKAGAIALADEYVVLPLTPEPQPGRQPN